MYTTSPSPAFPQFARLPAEIRLQIWHDVLPERDAPTFFTFKPGCWRALNLTDEDYAGWQESPDHQNYQRRIFRPNLLDPVQVKSPLASVNHEARAAFIEWAKEQDFEFRYCPKRDCLVVVRPFDSKFDTMYLTLNSMIRLVHEAFTGELAGPFPLQGTMNETGIPISLPRVAVPESAFPLMWQENRAANQACNFCDLLSCCDALEDMLVLVDPQPDFGDAAQGFQRRWVVQDTQEDPFVEDIPRCHSVLCGTGDKQKELYNRIRDFAPLMSNAFLAQLSFEFPFSIHFRIVSTTEE
ncbi:uncharacterized protein N7511_002646 [Penicillium nucicola]|uniref:uncharacterized protein n=1 Tax=Penicillium nucicola TaxID=1850975 RepID=UPI0025454E43|nr:uncharacterized protein N7511_002646 [Penicillium nucicola]KAJ5770595.1 hypothetical protein N7511_002646 [Penicillium nucicola]